MRQEFNTVDFVRLEVETATEGLANMVQNPSGELGGWGWITPIIGSAMEAPDGGGALIYRGVVGANYFTSEAMPVAAGNFVSARWDAAGGGGWYRTRLEWLDAAGVLLSSSAQSGYFAAGGGSVTYSPVEAPAATAYVRLRFDLFKTNTGTDHTSVETFWIREVTVAQAETSAELGSERTNLIPNPSFTADAAGWQGRYGSTIARIAAPGTMAPAQIADMVWGLQVTAGGATKVYCEQTTTSPITPSERLYLRGFIAAQVSATAGPGVLRTGVSVNIGVQWFSSGVLLSNATGVSAFVLIGDVDANGWVYLHPNGYMTPPPTADSYRVMVTASGHASGASYVLDRVLVEKVPAGTSGARSYFDGDTPDADGWEYLWTGAANASTSVAVSSNLPFIEPVTYFDILPESHQIRVARGELNAGRLAATVLSSSLDPSQSDLIRPGRRARLSCLVAGEWETLLGGKLLEADVTYELKDPRVPESKRARIEVVIIDPTQTLANAGRPEGVATINELPFVLEGAGVPWSVNGSGNQVPSANVTTYNDSAKALDQVALTRDTALGFAWMSRVGVLNVWDRSLIASGSPVLLNESDYSGLDLSFSTKDAINELQITVQALGMDGATTETVYGPFVDAPSIEEWGRYRKEFTVTGLDSAAVEALAAEILAANVKPRIRVNSITIPLRTVERLEKHALRDLYDEVNTVLDELDVDDVLRVTGIEHTIDTGKWMLTLRFSEEGGVAQPTIQPPVQSGARPDVGVIELFAGTTPPPGKLLCDGASYAVADYPFLHAVIGYSFGGAGAFFNVPDLTDRFPIGAGTKALGTSGGSPTVTLTAANLPAHTHPIARQDGAYAGGGGGTNVALGNAVNGPAGGTGVNAGTATPVDVLNPWLSIWFVIRAA